MPLEQMIGYKKLFKKIKSQDIRLSNELPH